MAKDSSGWKPDFSPKNRPHSPPDFGNDGDSAAIGGAIPATHANVML